MRIRGLKKIGTGVFLSVLIMNSNLPVNAQKRVVGSYGDFIIYDFSSNEENVFTYQNVPKVQNDGISKGYFPNGCIQPSQTIEKPSYGLQSIIEADDRKVVEDTTVGPYCNTVYLAITYSTGEQSTASGFVLGPKAVVTAAHVLYNDKRGGYPASITVIAAKNGDEEPYGRETLTSPANKIVVPTEYIKADKKGKIDISNDWGIIELESNIGNTTGWLGLRYQSASYNGTKVYNTGYPGFLYPGTSSEIDNRSHSHMYCGTGQIRKSEKRCLYGDWDNTKGNSGGPVYAYYPETGYTAIGILSGGPSDEDGENGKKYGMNSSYSRATRITKEMFDLFMQYR